MLDIKQKIKEKANELGFQDIGFARSQKLDKEIKVYKEWIASSNNAEMKWMEKNIHKRMDPSNILEDCKTVIVLAYNYFTGRSYPDDIDNKGKISRYAWGNDYHDVVLPKLFELEKVILSNNPDSKCRSYVDTGPILEKVWAERAGIGWQGKNSLVISKKNGSYFFLGVILTTAMIEDDKSYVDHCASCRKCIDACPTDAIIDNKIIDSTKCLSFWTIEAKPYHDIPEVMRDKNQNWIYGCDICQEVCPWNKNLPKPTNETLFYPKNDETAIDITNLLNMEKSTFSERFRKTPIKRTKLEGLQRNAKQFKFEKSD